VSSPMTFKEAVEIYRIHRELYAAQREFELTRGISEPVHADELARWDRARAIVDAAVEAHEARCNIYTGQEKARVKVKKANEAFARVCALERGESEVQQ
jgi:hypothetical protein